MARYRSSEILASESIATAGTKTIDINLKDPISRLIIQIKATGNGSTPTAHPAKIISKIEVLDGSNVITSLTGREAQALDFYDTGRPPFNNLTYLNDVMSMCVFNINFGRRVWDPDFALDPKKFNNLQLKIQHNLALGGAAPDACDLRVRADVFDEFVPTLRGFLLSKEHYSYSLVSSGVTYVDLPTDFVMRKLLVSTYADDKYPYEQINQIRLDEDHDKRVIFEGYQSDFIKYHGAMYYPYCEHIYATCSAAGVNVFVTPTYEVNVVGNGEGSGYYIVGDPGVGGGKRNALGSASVNFRGIVTGFCPHGCVQYPFGDQMLSEDWWDVTRLGSARLKLTAGSSVESSSTAEVVTQQLKPY